MIQLTTVIYRNNNLLAKNIDQELVVLDLKKGELFYLNETAKLIWKYLWRPREIKNIIKKITADYDVGDKQISEETLAFVKKHLDSLFLIIKE